MNKTKIFGLHNEETIVLIRNVNKNCGYIHEYDMYDFSEL